MARLAVFLVLTLIYAARTVQAGADWGDWGGDFGPLGDPEWWEGGGDHPPHGYYPGKEPAWLWFFRQGKEGLDGRDGRVGDMGDKGDCGDQGEKGEKGDRGDPGLKGMEGDRGDLGMQGQQGMKGYKGDTGDDGEDAMPMGGTGTKFYTRWGRKDCEMGDPQLATLVYSGRAGTSHSTNAGAGANIMCLTDEFDTSVYDSPDASASNTFASIVGVEYQVDRNGNDPLGDILGQNVPCAVCSVMADAVYMQPGSTMCFAGWTPQYVGYLMAERQTMPLANSRESETYRSHYVCVDDEAENVGEGITIPTNTEASLAHVSVDCSAAFSTDVLSCASAAYGDSKQIACVVCSK